MGGRKDRWTDAQIPPVFYRTLSPFGAVAQKGKRIACLSSDSGICPLSIVHFVHDDDVDDDDVDDYGVPMMVMIVMVRVMVMMMVSR